MKILCLELSTHLRSAAIMEGTPGGEWLTLGFFKDPDANFKKRESKNALAAIDLALKESGLAPKEVDAILVSTGPGSFTGIRISIALAQGWQAAHGTLVAGRSSIHSLARQSEVCSTIGFKALVIDAQKGEYNWLPMQSIPAESPEKQIELISKKQLEERVGQEIQILGPHLKKHIPESTEIYPDARDLATSLQTMPNWISATTLEAIYLRTPEFVKAPPPRMIPDVT